MSDLVEKIRNQARGVRRAIALPEVHDPRVLKAADAIHRDGIAEPVLIGDAQWIAESAAGLGLDLSGIKIVEQGPGALLSELIDVVCERRKYKGMTAEAAAEVLVNPVYFAVAMLAAGRVDGVVSGSASPTAEIMRPALQLISRQEGIRTVSGYFLMVHSNRALGEDGTFVFADCGLVPAPSADQLVEIAVSSAESFRRMVGAEPRVAMLSFSTKGSAHHHLFDHVIEATAELKRKHPELIVDGELQLDAAIIPDIAKLKCPDSPVAGRANVLIFPDLNAGNIGYKLVERFGGATALGPIVQGLQKPVNDLSRGCSIQDIVDLTAVTSVMSKSN